MRIMWTLVGALLVISMVELVEASQLVVASHIVRQGEVEADVGDKVELRCLGGKLGWEGDGDDGRYEEVEEAGSATSITIASAQAEDTGLFTCGRAELGEEVESVYLWVEDPSKLFRVQSPMLVVNVEVKILSKLAKIYLDKSCLCLEKSHAGIKLVNKQYLKKCIRLGPRWLLGVEQLHQRLP